MVDDAHGLGVVGPTGRGTAEKHGCTDRIDVLYGTLSKAPGAIGGYCAGDTELVTYLRCYARTYFFSTSLPAPTIAGLTEVFRILEEEPQVLRSLWENITYLRTGLGTLGFDTANTESAIIPVMVRDEVKLADLHNELRRCGVFTNIVTYPAVRRKECRLRVNVTRSLTRGDMDFALGVFAQLGRKYEVIQ